MPDIDEDERPNDSNEDDNGAIYCEDDPTAGSVQLYHTALYDRLSEDAVVDLIKTTMA